MPRNRPPCSCSSLTTSGKAAFTDPGGHGVEKDVGEGLADSSVAEALQGFITRVTFWRNEYLGGDAQFLWQAKKFRGNECRRRFRQAVELIGKYIAFARKVRTGQQQMFGGGILHQLHAVRLVGEKTVPACLEAETVTFDGAHGPARYGICLVDYQFPVGPRALQVEGSGQAADPGPDNGYTHAGSPPYITGRLLEFCGCPVVPEQDSRSCRFLSLRGPAMPATRTRRLPY